MCLCGCGCCRTNKHFQRKTRRAAESTCLSKKLMPYSPNAPRNRPKETVSSLYSQGVTDT
jgi:hypothetical protein